MIEHTGIVVRRDRDARQIAHALLSLVKMPGAPPSLVPEIGLFAVGRKPVLRLVVDSFPTRTPLRRLMAAGLTVRQLPVSSRYVGGSWSTLAAMSTDLRADESPGEMLVIARRALLADRFAEAEFSDHRVAGELLGYPQCCIEAVRDYEAAGGRWPQRLARTASSTSVDARANRLAADWGGISPVGELFPCSLECPAARAIGENGVGALRRLGLHRLAAEVVQHATTPVRIDTEGRAVPVHAADPGALRFRWPGDN